MSKKQKMLIVGGIIIILILLLTGIVAIVKGSGGKNNSMDKRDNILALAQEYVDRKEYQSALDLINSILIDNPEDEEARRLLDEIVAMKQADGGNENEFQDIQDREDKLADSLNKLNASLNRESPAERDARLKREAEDTAAREARLREEAAIRKQIDDIVKSGQRLLRRGKYDEAMDKINEALLLDPNSADAITLKNDITQTKRDAENAAERRAREEKERQLASILAEANKALKDERYDEAGRLAVKALNLAPDSDEAMTIRGDSIYLPDPKNKYNRDKAKKSYENALRHNPQGWKAHFRLGQIALHDGNLNTAIDEMEIALSLNLSEVEIAYELGKARFIARRFTDAVSAFEHVRSLEPDYKSNWFNLGLSYARLGNNKEAERAMRGSIKSQPDHAASHYELGRILLTAGNQVGAVDALQSATILASDKSAYWSALGTAHYTNNSWEAAKSAYLKALNLSPNDGDFLYNLSLIAMKQDKSDEAFPMIVKAVKIDGNNPIYLYTLGLVSEKLGMTEQAIAGYRKAAQMDPQYANPRINLGALYEKSGDSDKALEILLEAFRIEPNSVAVWNNLGKVYLLKKDYTNSLIYFQKAAVASPDDAELQMNLALTLTEMKYNEKAIEIYKKVIALDRTNVEARANLAKLLIAEGDNSSVKRIISEIERLDPANSALPELRSLMP